MLIALLVALVAINVLWVAVVDRKDRRHDQQLSRLLVHVQAPERAVAFATSVPLDGPLYAPAEGDESWRQEL